jgi:serine/threonine protein kinase
MTDSTKKSHEEQLSSFASELRNHVDDESMLQEIHLSIKAMLSGDGVSEEEVRDALQEQHDNGELREESFQLVQKLIDSIVTEELPTATLVLPSDQLPSATVVLPNDESDPFGSTTVIPTVTLSPGMADQQLQVGSVLRDRFMLTEEIKGGSMGTVYKALDRRLAEADEEEHFVAIKVLSPKLSYDADALRALQQEAVKTRCLSHPNIVRFIDLDRDDELYFMVMEWLDGRSLANILDDSSTTQMDLDTALGIVRQIGNALDYAHLRGVIHADVKPGNVMITPTGQAKLFDFGIARIRQKQTASQGDTDPAVFKAATPAYSSMQVLTGEEPVAADDVFSLACLAYRLIAGYRVFGPRNAAEAAADGMKPQRLENLNKSQWQALKKALAYSRVARYSSPAEFVKALTASTRQVEIPMEVGPVEDDTYIEEFDSGSRSGWRYVAVLVILAGAAAFVFQDDLIRFVRPYVGETIGFLSENEPITDAAAPAEQVVEGRSDIRTDQSATDVEPEPSLPDELETGDLSQELPDTSNTDSLIASAPEVEDAVDVDPPIETTTPVAAESVLPDAVSSAGPDFSSMPPANIILPLAGLGELPETASIALMEDGQSVIIDFVRASNLDEALQLKLQEREIFGRESARESGQYSVSNDGILNYLPGQHRARLTISMNSDSVRESDQHVALVVVDTEYGDFAFASIGLTMQDDDQRAYESRLAPNTVAFAVKELSVRESDAAIQMDVIRYKADNSSLDVAYVIQDLTTTEGEDYIASPGGTLSFEPGEKTKRILIPLVQDSFRESDEVFTIDLQGDLPYTEGNIYRRITVMIRDDDS